MNLDLLLSFVQAPQKMADHPVSDLEGMVAEYPYFSAAQLLLLKQYKLQNSSKFNKQLRHAAGILPDRKQLYRIIEMWPEEAEQAIAADIEVDVLPVPAEQLGLLQEEQSNLLTDAPIEMAAPLSEVPLEQLEEVQSFGKEIADEVSPSEVAAQAESLEVEEVAAPTQEIEVEIADLLTAEVGVIEEVDHDAVPVEEEGGATVPEQLTLLAVEQEIAENASPEEATSSMESAQTIVEALEPDAAADEVIEAPMEVLAAPEVEEIIAETMPSIEEWPVSEVTGSATPPEGVEQEQQTAEAPAASSAKKALEPAVPEEEQPAASAVIAPIETITEHHGATNAVAAPTAQAEVEAFIAKPHDRLSWFKFFAGKPLREQSDEVLDQLYQEHMQQDLLRAPEQDQQISAIRAQINREEEVPSSKALEEEIRRLAYESISDEELPASETLAGIYAAQHDYKKAIRIYQKLILKFPDKMSYFARLIEELRAKS